MGDVPATQVAELHDQLDQLLALDLDTLTDTELDETLIDLQRARARLGAATARLVQRWAQRGIWSSDGSRSPAARLARDTRTSLTTARVELRRADHLAHMPGTEAALAAGELSLDHVDLLGRARTNNPDVFAEHEAMLIGQCRRLRFTQARHALDYWAQHANPDGAKRRDDRRRERAHFHASSTLDGMIALDGMLDPIGGAIFTNELDRLEHDLYLQDQRDGTDRSAAQRRAAALVEMATRSAAMPADARRPKPLLTVLVGDSSLTQLCELENGTVLHPSSLAPLLDTAILETVLFDGPHTVISVSHRRSFTGAVRRAIQVRDRNCTHPAGCDEPGPRCDVDHIVPAAAGGRTSQFNGRLECTPHNRRHDLHDHGAQPWPERTLTELDHIRARIRWRLLRDDPADP